MIRLVQDKDKADCFRLSKMMYGEFLSRYGIDMNEADLMKTVEQFVASRQVLICEREGSVRGIAAWILTGHPANLQLKIFQEVLWCIDSDNKFDAMELLRALESKAVELMADIIVLANLSEMNEDRLRRIYKRKGFEYMESHYSKRRF